MAKRFAQEGGTEHRPSFDNSRGKFDAKTKLQSYLNFSQAAESKPKAQIHFHFERSTRFP
jgi:hypothetical protein